MFEKPARIPYTSFGATTFSRMIISKMRFGKITLNSLALIKVMFSNSSTALSRITFSKMTLNRSGMTFNKLEFFKMTLNRMTFREGMITRMTTQCNDTLQSNQAE